jgi:hypothetical protein
VARFDPNTTSPTCHSITSSVVASNEVGIASNEVGIARLSALTVLRLITSSNLVA